MTPLSHIFQDPPPAWAFELSESGVAWAKTGSQAQLSFQAFDGRVLSVSPVHDNVQDAVALERAIRNAVGAGARRKRTALILPDYCARVAVLDFDNFPAGAEEGRSLVRFRMKKSVPFDVDSAVVSYYVQPRTAAGRYEVVVAIMAREIVTRYEAPFRALALQPGWISTSALSMLQLVQPSGVTVILKLTGRAMTVLVLSGPALKLARCVEVESSAREDVEAVLLPTMAYIEDELQTAAQRLLLAGFGSDAAGLAEAWADEWNVIVEPLQSRRGAPEQTNAGLLGYLESIGS